MQQNFAIKLTENGTSIVTNVLKLGSGVCMWHGAVAAGKCNLADMTPSNKKLFAEINMQINKKYCGF